MQNERDIEFDPSAELSDIRREGKGEELGATMHQTAERVKNKVDGIREQATEKAESRVAERKHRAAGSLGSVAQTLRSAGQQLPAENEMGHFIVRAADEVDQFANYLESHDVAELIDNVEDFARRQPGIFVGGAFALGVIGARFLKSSRRDLVSDGVREGWSTREMTSRVESTDDAVSRPGAPGYVPSDERDLPSDVGFR